MELTGNEDRPQCDRLCGSGKRKAAELGNYSGARFPPLYKLPSTTVHHRRWLAAAEEGSGCDDYAAARENF
jgi:hypothetical protein